jgi:hypothetical protein
MEENKRKQTVARHKVPFLVAAFAGKHVKRKRLLKAEAHRIKLKEDEM